MNILVTGGTTFVSKAIAEYFSKDNKVYVLNRNTKKQLNNVTLIEVDRNNLGDKLKGYSFDIVIDVTSYNKNDVENLVNALNNINEYIFISSSAIYPEDLPQPFKEDYNGGYNSIWKDYGINKLEAEEYLKENVKQAYIIRPPYLYGPYNNIYREAFVFDCAMNDRTFYIPKDGNMKLQFFYIYDLCRFIEKLIELKPKDKVYNVGNEEIISINDWVKLCYKVVKKELNIVNVDKEYNQRDYFPFYDYEYELDVTKQKNVLSMTTNLYEGLKETYNWYKDNQDQVKKKNYIEFIDENLR